MITIISPHMNSNALGRALVLAQVAEFMGRAVRIVGSTRRGDDIWAPMRPYLERYNVQTFPLYGTRDYPRAARTLRAMLAGSKGPVIVSKPLPTSLGLALMAGVNPWGKGVVLDVDDWELGFRLKGDEAAFDGPLQAINMILGSLPMDRMNTDLGVLTCERIATSVPHKIASNTWLQRRFGGRLLPHVRDAHVLRPTGPTQGAALRQELSMDPARLWVGFIGTPRIHKGIDVLIDALAQVPEAIRPGLVLLGCSEHDDVSEAFWNKAVATLGSDAVRRKGSFPFDALPDHVAAVDVVVIPSVLTTESVGQIPAKLFDAMAMAKPVIVSDVNDMKQIIEGVGEVFAPGDVAGLSDALMRMIQRGPERRGALGLAARQRFLQRYDLESGAQMLSRVLKASYE